MAGIIHFETFLVAGILLNLTPGNDTIYILSISIGQGRKAGILSVLGIATGSLIHTLLAALGLSIIIAKSMVAFTIVKYAGAAYLIYIGLRMIFGRKKFETVASKPSQKMSSLRVYRDAVFTNVLNPKVAMFFIAFLPQFIDPGYQNSMIPFILLGLTFTLTGTAWCLVLASFSAFIFSRLRENHRVSAWLNSVCGAVLVALGIRIALTGRK